MIRGASRRLPSACVSAWERDLITYIDMSRLRNAGHCPNHEAPTATAAIVNRWLEADEGARCVIKLVEGNTEEFKEEWGMNYIREIGADEISMSIFDRIITKFV